MVYMVLKKGKKINSQIVYYFFYYFSFNMPNFPCSDTSEQLSVKKHLMYKHNLSNTAGILFDI
jgi:hypothetical protein